MSTRDFVGLRASIVLFRSLYLDAPRSTCSLRPFSVTVARCESKKIRTRFSGPQTHSPKETVALTSSKQLPKKSEISLLQPLITRNPSASEERAISFAETRPFPEQDLSSTRPPALETPKAPEPRDHDGNIPLNIRLSYLYRLGKSYVSFYKAGLKNLWSNYKEYREIKRRLGPFPLNDVVKYSGKGGRPTISRREYQLCLRTRNDIRKLIPFGLILLVCGEFTPLVVLALGSAVVPSTCHIPRQVMKDHVNQIKRLEKLDDFVPGVDSESIPSLAFLEAKVGYVWGLMPSQRPLPLVHSLLRPRVRRHAEELVCDAILVRREGGVARLDPSELTQSPAWATFDLQMKRRFGDSGIDHVNPEEKKTRVAQMLEKKIDLTLNMLQKFEHRPDRHYIAGLRY